MISERIKIIKMLLDLNTGVILVVHSSQVDDITIIAQRNSNEKYPYSLGSSNYRNDSFTRDSRGLDKNYTEKEFILKLTEYLGDL